MSILLDSHALHWWSTEPDRLSDAAVDAIEAAGELAVASITWFELAWLARHDRIVVAVPIVPGSTRWPSRFERSGPRRR